MLIMKWNFKSLLTALPLLVLSTLVNADDVACMAGGTLQTICRGGDENRKFVSGYLLGVLNGFQYTRGAAGWCPDDKTTIKESVDIFCKYLSAHPEKNDYNGARLIDESMKKAFPCD
ncbi:MAG: hypothetical protein GY792_08620 [Gammaproteobacteria bacterium]|nr:hypothetical protein [Gammaproteobacteria bacterium]